MHYGTPCVVCVSPACHWCRRRHAAVIQYELQMVEAADDVSQQQQQLCGTEPHRQSRLSRVRAQTVSIRATDGAGTGFTATVITPFLPRVGATVVGVFNGLIPARV